jgi:hypothetical protein
MTEANYDVVYSQGLYAFDFNIHHKIQICIRTLGAYEAYY